MNRYRRLGIVIGATALVMALSLGVPLLGQEKTGGRSGLPEDPWSALRFFVGSWEGTGQGDPGTSVVEFNAEFVLQGQYLFTKTKAVFDPQEKNPKGETHEDWGVFSYDSGRKKFVLRQFNSEGFVNQYVLEEISSDGKTMVFTTEHVENGPPGLRARSTYKILSDDEFTETFELAFPGKDFSPCVETRLKRKK